MQSPLPVLILDDEKDNLEALRRLLRSQYAVTTAVSPFEALKLLLKTEYSAIVSDQRMPEMTGVEFLEKAKSVSPDTTRILLTGYTDLDSVIGAINRGNIYRYIAKPWDPEDIKQTLRQACDAFVLRKELREKNEELSAALAEVRGLDEAKARFMALVSHELNTPMTSLQGFLSLLDAQRGGLPTDVARSIDRISEASARLQAITTEVIEYVRLGTEARWERTAFDWESEWVAAAKDLSPLIQEKQISIAFERAFSRTADCDPTKTRVALRKWLAEFASAAPVGSQLRLSLRTEGDTFEVALARTGAPLPADALKPLEMSSALQHHTSNLGLRLATCRFVFEQQGAVPFLDSNPTSTRMGFRFSLI